VEPEVATGEVVPAVGEAAGAVVPEVTVGEGAVGAVGVGPQLPIRKVFEVKLPEPVCMVTW